MVPNASVLCRGLGNIAGRISAFAGFDAPVELKRGIEAKKDAKSQQSQIGAKRMPRLLAVAMELQDVVSL